MRSISQHGTPRHLSRRRRRSLPALFIASISPQQRIVLAVASFVLALGLTGAGVYATFSSSAAATHSASTGTLSLAFGATGSVTNRMTVNATDILPGDTYYRTVDLSNTGSKNFSLVSLTSTASPSSLLDTNTTNGLQLVIQRCTTPWVEAGVSPNFTYTCGGTTQSVLATRPVIGSSLGLLNISAATAGGVDRLRFAITLPSGADNTYQGLTSGLTFTFNGSQ